MRHKVSDSQSPLRHAGSRPVSAGHDRQDVTKGRNVGVTAAAGTVVDSGGNAGWHALGAKMATATVFGLFFLFVWRVINPVLHYQVGAPVFFLNQTFFRPFLGHPGGLLEWVASAWLQCYSCAWLGALLTTGLAWLIYRETGIYILAAGARPSHLVQWVPMVLLVGLETRYDPPVVGVVLGTALTLGALIAHLRCHSQRLLIRLPLFLAMSGFLYWSAAEFFLWFLLLAGIVEFRRSLWRRVVVSLLGGLLIPGIVAELFFKHHLTNLRFSWFTPSYGTVLWYGFWPFATLVIQWLNRPVLAPNLPTLGTEAKLHSHPHPPHNLTKSSPAIRESRWWRFLATWRWARTLAWPPAWFAPLGLAPLVLALGYASLDKERKATLQMDYYARQKEWRQVVQQASRLSRRTVGQELDLQRALFHLGLLPHEQFAYPQDRTQGLLVSFYETYHFGALPLSETLLELGQVNHAEHWASEALAKQSESPVVLRQLALVQRLKGQCPAAAVFLNRLAENPVYHRWAINYLLQMQIDPMGKLDTEMTHIQRCLLGNDRAGSYLEMETLLKRSLAANRRNQMAFEYLMAHYLLTRQLDKLVSFLGRLIDFNYAQIPRHYEEALVLYQRLNAGKEVQVPGYQIDPQSLRRYRAFDALFQRFIGDRRAARRALEPEFGRTYWFYYVFATTSAPAVPNSLPPSQ